LKNRKESRFSSVGQLIRKRDEERIVDGQTRNRADAQVYSLEQKSGSQ
jgi:hypothetical protein